MSKAFMSKPCAHCPFRHDVKPFLTTERAEELAFHATNPYNTFPCHKTTEAMEDEEGDSEMIATQSSKECAGFLTLMSNEAGRTMFDDEGFEPSYDVCYNEPYEMIDAYAEANEQRGKP
jgi:hypothetical protein